MTQDIQCIIVQYVNKSPWGFGITNAPLIFENKFDIGIHGSNIIKQIFYLEAINYNAYDVILKLKQFNGINSRVPHAIIMLVNNLRTIFVVTYFTIDSKNIITNFDFENNHIYKLFSFS